MQQEELEMDFPNFNDETEMPNKDELHERLEKPIKEMITTHFKNLKFQNYQLDGEYPKIRLTIQLEQFSMKFLAFCTTEIDYKRKRIDCWTYLAKPDGDIIQVREKYLHKLLCRYFCRLNTSLRFGCFCIDTDTGQIMLKLNSVVIEDQWLNLIQTYEHKQGFSLTKSSELNLSQLLKQLHFTSHYALGFHIYRLMHLINKLSYKVFPFLEQKLQNQYRKLQDNAEGHLIKINDIILNKCTQELTQKELDEFKSYFQLQRPQNKDLKILNLLHLAPNETIDTIEQNHNLIGEGGFSKVYRSEIQYSQTQSGFPIQKRNIVCKVDKPRMPAEQVRVPHEKSILAHMSQPMVKNGIQYSGYCPHIAQFYTTPQANRNTDPNRNFDKILFMDFYHHTSLDSFRAKFQAIQSLNTKLFILLSIATAVRYMHAYGVIHNDLKPANILISKNYTVKITDFGEASCRDIDSEGGKGFTLPFSSPEVIRNASIKGSVDTKEIQQQHPITCQSDIFSFGMLMYEFLFDHYPIDFKKSHQAHLLERYKNGTYTIRSNPDLIKKMGPKHLMKCLRNLSLRCLHPDPKQRPIIDWILVCLRESLQYVEKMY